jgi:itaconate CoA-transferase
MYAYSAILAALIERGKTGQGVRLDVSMLESMAEWMSFPLYYAFDGAAAPPRAGAAHATIYPYGPFQAGDGKAVMLGLQNEREWQWFCAKVLRQPALAGDERFNSNAKRVAAREALAVIIDEVFSTLTSEQLIERLEDAQIANAHVNDMQAVWAHPQLAARQRWSEVASPAGAIPALKPPALPASFDARMDPVPALGGHTDALLAELGFDAETVQRLRRGGAV